MKSANTTMYWFRDENGGQMTVSATNYPPEELSKLSDRLGDQGWELYQQTTEPNNWKPPTYFWPFVGGAAAATVWNMILQLITQ